MAKDSKEIITYIEKNYPMQDQEIAIKNCSDLNIEAQIKPLNQYIIGVTPADMFSNEISQYEHNMKEKLANVSPYFRCLPWPFYDYEIDELKTTLSELSDYFQANLDIERMIKDLNIKKETGKMYYVVITVVQYPIIYVE
jgi:hypothetical protein